MINDAGHPSPRGSQTQIGTIDDHSVSKNRLIRSERQFLAFFTVSVAKNKGEPNMR